MKRIDLNCDVGEGVGNEAELMPWVSSVSIACGGHAGDDRTMEETMALARSHGVTVGGHPGFVDREGFGRREIALGDEEIVELVAGQLEALAKHGEIAYVKPHGALYNLASRERRIADAVVKGVLEFDPTMALLGLAGGKLIDAGSDAGLRVVREGFVDRRYDLAGKLIGRGMAGAVIADAEVAVAQGLSMVLDGAVESPEGGRVSVSIESICVHGDSEGAVGFVERLRRALERAGVEVAAFV